MISIDADAVAREMDPRTLVDALRAGHAAGRSPTVERMLLEGEDATNSCLIWGGWQRRAGIAVKIASVFPANEASGMLPNVQSVVLLLNGESGRPQSIIYGESFTKMKTAADSALGTQILAKSNPTDIAVLGAGGQADTHVRFLMAVRPSLRTVRIWNRSGAKADALAKRLSASTDRPVDAIASTSVEDAVRDADIVTCLTASTEPVLRGEWLKPGAHVDLVGGYTPSMRECDDAAVLRSRCFADSRRFTMDVCGDYSDPIARGVISPDDVEADLFDLCDPASTFFRKDHDITLFKNGGGGHLDLFAALAFRDFSKRGA